MKLNSEVQMLLAQGASKEIIDAKMEQVYNYPSGEHLCWSLLAVYAVHYNHPDANFYCRALRVSTTRFDASITAVVENKLQYVPGFGELTDVLYISETSYCHDHKLGVKAYGIVNNDGTICESKISPLDVIPFSDEADSFGYVCDTNEAMGNWLTYQDL